MINLLEKQCNFILEFLSAPRRMIGTAIIRVALSIYMLVIMISHLRERGFLWGNNGVFRYEVFTLMLKARHTFSLYALSPNENFSLYVYVCGILISALFLLGVYTRVTSVLFFIFTWSLYQRNLFIMDGGDNLLYLLAFWLMFVESGKYLSIISRTELAYNYTIRSVIHNFGVAAIVAQVMILYATSAISKLTGPLWQNGTAIYYILRVDEFNLSPIAHILWDNAVILTCVTYSIILFQALWPILIWYKYTKPLMVIGAITMHVSIAYFMGLTWFSFVMISAEAIVFSDEDYLGYSRSIVNSALYFARFGRPKSLTPITGVNNADVAVREG
jgi:hypothetical protein